MTKKGAKINKNEEFGDIKDMGAGDIPEEYR